MSERKKWDKDEWGAKAKNRDAAAADYAKKSEEARLEGKKYRPDNRPQPTAHAQAHGDLQLNKNLGKTMLVTTAAAGTKGPRGAGFYCELCNRTLKDSISYLDHLNSRFHLNRLGQSTQVSRSTVAQVRERIRQLREASKEKVDAKNYDFQRRLAEVRAADEARKEARREERKRKRAARRDGPSGKADVSMEVQGSGSAEGAEMDSMEAMMGFGGFGSRKK